MQQAHMKPRPAPPPNVLQAQWGILGKAVSQLPVADPSLLPDISC